MNTKFGKLVGGCIEYAPDRLIDGDSMVFTTDPALMLQHGYKMIVKDGAITNHYTITEDDTSITVHYNQDIDDVRMMRLAQLDAYDKSTAVNEFYLGEVGLWADKDDRTTLERAVDKWEAEGNTTYPLCDEKIGVVNMPIETMRLILKDIEVYAIKCMQRTFEHKMAIKALNTIEEIQNYDFTTGYPDKLVFNIQ